MLTTRRERNYHADRWTRKSVIVRYGQERRGFGGGARACLRVSRILIADSVPDCQCTRWSRSLRQHKSARHALIATPPAWPEYGRLSQAGPNIQVAAPPARIFKLPPLRPEHRRLSDPPRRSEASWELMATCLSRPGARHRGTLRVGDSRLATRAKGLSEPRGSSLPVGRL